MENFLLEIFELFYFNESKKHDFKNLSSVYKSYLETLELSYREEFHKNVNKIFDEIAEDLFPQLSEYKLTKKNLYDDIHKELREYFYVEKENNIKEENEFINKYIFLNLYDNQNNDSQKLNENKSNEIQINNNYLSKEVKNLDDYSDLIDEEISINDKQVNRNIKLDYKSQKYKIDNKDIMNLKKIERKFIEEIINNLLIEISNRIKEYLEEQIQELRKIIEREIIDKLKKEQINKK